MSVADLHARAARFFLLAEQASRLYPLSRTMFWEMSVSPVRDQTACLPALAAAVRKADDKDALWELAFHPLPGVLPPEAVPWHNRLVEAWEVQRASRYVARRKPARQALVRLDGCGMPTGMQRPSRLPEWLAEARRMASSESRVASSESRMERLKTLAALADWRPARGVIPPPEALREWVAFWLEMRQAEDPVEKGIAARALLNLPEADLRSASLQPVPPEQLLRNLAAAIPAAAERTAWNRDDTRLLLLDWQPVRGTAWPAAEMAEMARAWLEVTSHNHWRCREMAWQQLVRWDRTGGLAFCGMDLLPFLVSAAQTEEDGGVLWEMAQWSSAAGVFTGTEKPDRLNLLRELEARWKCHRQSWYWLVKGSAWLAGIYMRRVGLAMEPPDSFREAYLAAVAQEHNVNMLFILAQWAPGAAAPAALHRKWRQGWQNRLGEKDEWIPQAAAFALLHQALGNESGEGLRRVALEKWRTGTEEGQATGQILNAALSRLHKVREELAAGRIPDFEAGPTPPAQRQYTRLVLPPGHITDREWRIENEKLKMENHEGALGPANRPAPDGLSR